MPEDRVAYIKLRDHCSKLASEKKTLYFQNEFKKHSYSPKSLFSFVDTFMDKDQDLVLPPGDSLVETVENFNQFFQEKINTIRSKFTKHSTNDYTSRNAYHGTGLCDFAPATIEEISTILRDCEFKSSSMDPLPASVMKENLDILLPQLCEIVNLSLSSGNVDGVKLAHITPLIKGIGLDHAKLNNYRPISNLSIT